MVRTGGVPVVFCFALLYVITPSFLLGLHTRRAQAALHSCYSPLLRGDPWSKAGSQPGFAGYANL